MHLHTLATVAVSVLLATPTIGDAAEEGQRSDIIGAITRHISAEDDSLVALAQRNRVGFIGLRAANPGLNAWVPGKGTEIVLPTAHILPEGPRRGIVINLPELRLYHFRPGKPPVSYPIGIGRDGRETPAGLTFVEAKRVNPTWYPTPSIRADKPELPAAVPPGPDNPLGSRGIYLAFGTYVIHGTNKPAGVGRYVSRGCIRMYEEDVQELYEQVDIGTPVSIVYQPVKIGWSDGALYVEVHPNREQANEIEATGTFSAASELGVEQRIFDKAGDAERVDWDSVARALRERRGLPVRITFDD